MTHPSQCETIPEEDGFALLGLKEPLLQTVKKAGFKTPSDIQKEVIPLILQGLDVIGQAQTGTGKTAAFGLPAIQLLQNTGGVEVLVIAPTRELASQVGEELHKLGNGVRLKVATIYGGKSFQAQLDSIRRGAQVVVATPGRLLDLLQSGKLPNFNPSLVVVDEADEMLDMGFLEDIQAIFEFLPKHRQTLLFSATIPMPIQSLAKRILRSPSIVKSSQSQATNADIAQYYCVVEESERDEAIIRLFEADAFEKSIIFCKTKKEVDRLSQVLAQRGYIAGGLHGDMEQSQRETITHSFRTGKCSVLVATDVAARGLNIVDVSHVVNYHLPFDAENYVHRIGRTGRAGRKGISITLVSPRELRRLLQFKQSFGGDLERRSVPSKQEVRQAQIKKLIHEIAEQIPAAETSSVINALEDRNPEALVGRLLGWILSQNPIRGPETIGVQGAVVPERSERTRFDRRRPEERGRRQERSESDQFGSYSKKKFAHPSAGFKKAKKRY